VEHARAADLLVLRITAHSTAREPLSLLTRARDFQQTVGGFRAFAPLPRTFSVAAPTTGYDDVKLVALARLMCPDIPSIQVDWPLYGPKLAQVALTVGADDVDGVVAADASVLGVRRSAIEEIKGNILAAGQQPVERDGMFRAMTRTHAGGQMG
jgi:aminodeoxyfutalosine synthase